MAPLIDTEYFEQQMNTLGLKATFAPQDETLETLIDEASDWVQAYCRRKFGEMTLTEDHWGSGTARLILNEFPVAEVTSITAVNRSGHNAIAPAVGDVRVLSSSGLLELKSDAVVWYSEHLYTVTYSTPGPVPGPVKRATALKLVEFLDPQYFPGKTKNVELITNAQEQMVTLLEEYRRERIG